MITGLSLSQATRGSKDVPIVIDGTFSELDISMPPAVLVDATLTHGGAFAAFDIPEDAPLGEITLTVDGDTAPFNIVSGPAVRFRDGQRALNGKAMTYIPVDGFDQSRPGMLRNMIYGDSRYPNPVDDSTEFVNAGFATASGEETPGDVSGFYRTEFGSWGFNWGATPVPDGAGLDVQPRNRSYMLIATFARRAGRFSSYGFDVLGSIPHQGTAFLWDRVDQTTKPNIPAGSIAWEWWFDTQENGGAFTHFIPVSYGIGDDVTSCLFWDHKSREVSVLMSINGGAPYTLTQSMPKPRELPFRWPGWGIGNGAFYGAGFFEFMDGLKGFPNVAMECDKRWRSGDKRLPGIMLGARGVSGKLASGPGIAYRDRRMSARRTYRGQYQR